MVLERIHRERGWSGGGGFEGQLVVRTMSKLSHLSMLSSCAIVVGTK